MSEFSSSWLIRTTEGEDAHRILTENAVAGWYTVANDWTVVVPKHNKNLSKIFNGTCISYEFGEDHGMWLVVYHGAALVSRYACEFEEMDEDNIAGGVNNSALNIAVLAPLLSCDTSALLNALDPQSFDEAFEVNHTFMALLGIPPELYEWVSPDYLEDRGGIDNAFLEI